MPKSKASAGAPKKARCSTEKQAAQASTGKTPHRRQAPSPPASTGTNLVGGREWRAPREEHRSSDRPSYGRDDRRTGGYQRRDDRPSYSRDNRDDRGNGGNQRRDDRPSYSRDDRGTTGYQR